MPATVNVNGRISPEAEAVISVFDHGFLYGEGIYETMRTYNNRPFLFDRHMRRLRNSARMIALDLPFTDGELAMQITETRDVADVQGEAYIRVLVTRGIGELTYDPHATPTPSIVIIVKRQVDPPPEAYKRGVRVVHRGRRPQPPRHRQPSHQEQQSAQLRARRAAGNQARRV